MDNTCPIHAIESCVLSEYQKATRTLRFLPATLEMQKELQHVSYPFFLKLKELGYTDDEARAKLLETFNHHPPRTIGRQKRVLAVT